jgi:hypothetical protein
VTVHPFRPAQKITAPINVGDKVGRWLLTGKSRTKRSYFTALCECGSEREVYKGQIKAGNSFSCGCLSADRTRARLVGKESPNKGREAREETRRLIGEASRKAWADGAFDTPACKEHLERLGKNHIGVAERGKNAAGPENKGAKYFRLLSPQGVVVEGLNLNHLVRENAQMFDSADVEPYRNGYGTAHSCRAVIGLHKLFQHGENRRNSWKGWTAATPPPATSPRP